MPDEDPPVLVRPSRADAMLAHAEGSITEDAVLAAARERAEDIGADAVTPAVGALLSMLTRLSGGKAVAEVGTGAGVSGLWMLSGMRDDGVLTTIDIEPEHQRLAKQAFSEGGIGPSRTRLITGRAQDVLTRLADDDGASFWARAAALEALTVAALESRAARAPVSVLGADTIVD